MKPFCCLLTLLILAALAPAALGDGGAVLLHRDAGPFTITLFSAGLPIEAGEADLSVMVQDRASGAVLLDPIVDMSVTGDGADATPVTVRLTHSRSKNGLLQGGMAPFRRAGRWRLTIDIRRGKDVGRLSTELTVEPDRSRAALVWFYLALPLGIILLFVAHQRLKRGIERNRERRS